MGLFNNFDKWHNKAMNDVNACVQTKAPISRFKLVAANFKTVGTGAADIFANLLKLVLIQPVGMLAKGGLGLVRAVTYSNLAQPTYDKLSGPTDWVKTTRKLTILSIGELVSIIGTVGSLVTPKVAQYNVRFQNNRTFEKAPLPILKTPEQIKAEDAAKKAAEEAAAKKAADEKAFAELVAEANKYDKIKVIQTKAQFLKDEAFRLGKIVEGQKKTLDSALTAAVTADVQTMDALIAQGDKADAVTNVDAKNAKAHADSFQTLIKQADAKLKANQTDQATVDGLAALAKEAQALAQKAQDDANATATIAQNLKNVCTLRKTDASNISNYETAAATALADANKAAVEAQNAQQNAEKVKGLADGIVAANKKDQAALKPLVAQADIDLQAAVNGAAKAATELQRFQKWLDWANGQKGLGNKFDPKPYDSFIAKIQGLQGDARVSLNKAEGHLVAVKAAVDDVKTLYVASQLRGFADILKDGDAASVELAKFNRLASARIADANKAWDNAVKEAKNKTPNPTKLDALIADANKQAADAATAIASAKTQAALAKQSLSELKALEAAKQTSTAEAADIVAFEKVVTPAVSEFGKAEKDAVEANMVEGQIRILQTAIVEANKRPSLKDLLDDAQNAYKAAVKAATSVDDAHIDINTNLKNIGTADLDDVEDLIKEAKRLAQEAATNAPKAQAEADKFAALVADVKIKNRAYQASDASVLQIEDLAAKAAKKAVDAKTEAEEIAKLDVDAAYTARVAKEIAALKLAASEAARLAGEAKGRVVTLLAKLDAALQIAGGAKAHESNGYLVCVTHLTDAKKAVKEAEDQGAFALNQAATLKTLKGKNLIPTAEIDTIEADVKLAGTTAVDAKDLLGNKVKDLISGMNGIVTVFKDEVTTNSKASDDSFTEATTALQKAKDAKTVDEAYTAYSAAITASHKARAAFVTLEKHSAHLGFAQGFMTELGMTPDAAAEKALTKAVTKTNKVDADVQQLEMDAKAAHDALKAAVAEAAKFTTTAAKTKQDAKDLHDAISELRKTASDKSTKFEDVVGHIKKKTFDNDKIGGELNLLLIQATQLSSEIAAAAKDVETKALGFVALLKQADAWVAARQALPQLIDDIKLQQLVDDIKKHQREVVKLSADTRQFQKDAEGADVSQAFQDRMLKVANACKDEINTFTQNVEKATKIIATHSKKAAEQADTVGDKKVAEYHLKKAKEELEALEKNRLSLEMWTWIQTDPVMKLIPVPATTASFGDVYKAKKDDLEGKVVVAKQEYNEAVQKVDAMK